MKDNLSLFELLSELGGADLLVRRSDSVLAVAVIGLAEGRRLMAIERTYREGVCVIIDPTPKEIETAKSGELWDLWNSDRSQLLFSVL